MPTPEPEPMTTTEPTAAPDPEAAVPIGPWRRRSRQVAYENPWVVVWHDEVDRPDGQAGVYGVVHFKNVAVAILAIDDDGRVPLVGQHRYTLAADSWEIPEGGVPHGQNPLEGARRELREETGLSAVTWTELGSVHLSNSVSDEIGVIYLATDLTPGQPEPDGTEALEVRWLPFAEALAMTVDGRITDALSVIALQRVALTRLAVAAALEGEPAPGPSEASPPSSPPNPPPAPAD